MAATTLAEHVSACQVRAGEGSHRALKGPRYAGTSPSRSSAALQNSFVRMRPQRARRMVWLFPSHPSEAARCASTGEHLVCLLLLLPSFLASLPTGQPG